jgi:hypothetical protein
MAAASDATRDAWNACRFVRGTSAGHYESWFQRANHPERPLAFWIRYTVFSPRSQPQAAVGELWALCFDSETQRVVAVKQVVPIADCTFSDRSLDVQIGRASLRDGRLQGEASSGAHTLQWALDWTGSDAPLLLLPKALYGGRFPKAKALVGTPNASFSGEIVVDGDRWTIDSWQGSQNHNWGSQHTDSYAWGQVAGFDGAPDVFLECSTARLRVAGLWTPPLSVIVVRIGEREFALNGLRQALRARGRVDVLELQLDSQPPDKRITAEFSAPRSAFAGLRYDNPPGGAKTCLNSKLAECRLTVAPTGERSRSFVTRRRAAFEILTDRTDHGVAMLA